eukprot:973587-Pelagomonas_calceolata.AAC.1
MLACWHAAAVTCKHVACCTSVMQACWHVAAVSCKHMSHLCLSTFDHLDRPRCLLKMEAVRAPRIDPVIQATKASLQQLPPTPPSIKAAAPSLAAGGSGNGGYDGCASAAVKATRGEAAIKERERALLPVYQQVGVWERGMMWQASIEPIFSGEE